MNTRAVHAGARRPAPGASVPAAPDLEQASAGLFANLDDVESAYAGDDLLYRPLASANATQLEAAMAELEAPGRAAEVCAVATSSGMAAINLAALLRGGEGPLVSAPHVYGATRALFERELGRLGMSGKVVDPADEAQLDLVLGAGGTLFVETVSNPLLYVADLPRLAELCHRHGAQLLVDNTFASPVLCRPLEQGADLVMHSTTKYLSGHGDAVAGVLVAPAKAEPRLRELMGIYRPIPAPLDAWLTLRGIRTLALRVKRASDNALELATWLEAQPQVSRVWYPGLPSHPSHAVAKRALDGGFGGMLSFELAGGGDAAAAFARSLGLVTIMASLADVATTISYPIRTSHRGLSAEEHARLGITAGLLRMSVGIEDVEDIRADLATALAAAG